MLRSVTAYFTTLSTPATDLTCPEPQSMLAVSHWAEKTIPLTSSRPHIAKQRNANPTSRQGWVSCVTSQAHSAMTTRSTPLIWHPLNPSLTSLSLRTGPSRNKLHPTSTYPAQRLLRQAIRPTGLHTLARLGSLELIPVLPTTSTPVLLA